MSTVPKEAIKKQLNISTSAVTKGYTYPSVEGLLLSKFTPPEPSQLLERLPLFKKMNTGLSGPLILISAPPGFGKTSLLASWIKTLDRPAAWLSLDENDDDESRFHFYIEESVFRAVPTLDRLMLIGSDDRHRRHSNILLLNALAAKRQELVICIDDVHHLKNQKILDNLRMIIDHLPQGLTIVLSSRTNPELPLARYKANRKMVLLDSQDLRFSREESNRFIRTHLNQERTAKEIADLHLTSEGWIAGLIMLCMGKNSRSNTLWTNKNDFGDFDRYLEEEVFTRLPKASQDFLLFCSVLTELEQNICREVSGFDNADSLLDQAASDNLFLIPLSRNPNRYRFHQIFHQFLRRQLIKCYGPEKKRDFHMRAFRELSKKNQWEEACNQVLALQDWNLLARFLNDHTEDLLARGQSGILNRFTREIPLDVLNRFPQLCICTALSRFLASESLTKITPLLTSIELRNLDDYLKGALHTLKSIIALFSTNFHEYFEEIRRAETLLANHRGFFPGFLNYINSWTFYVEPDDFESYGEVCEHNARQALSDGNWSIAISYYVEFAGIQRYRGQPTTGLAYFNRAEEICRAHQSIETPLGMSIIQGKAEIYYEKNQLANVEESLLTLSRLEDSWGPINRLQRDLLSARFFAALDDYNSCEEALIQAETRAIRFDASDLDDIIVRLERHSLGLAHNYPSFIDELDTVKNEIDRLAGSLWNRIGISDFLLQNLKLIGARSYWFFGNPEAALNLLEGELSFQNKRKANSHSPPLLAFKGMLKETLGRDGKNDLLLALRTGSRTGLVRSFVDLGTPVMDMIASLDVPNSLKHYKQTLLQSCPLPQPSITPEVELTPREKEILLLVKEGKSNKEIGAALFVSDRTVKWHLARIYAKLEVHNRTGALAVARAHGWQGFE